MTAQSHLAAAAVALYLPAAAAAAAAVGFPNITDPVYPESFSCARFVRLGFDPQNFARYGDFFTEQSSLTLAPAGTYVGIDSIREYIMFASTHGLMFTKLHVVQQRIHFGGVKLKPGGHECVIHLYRKQHFMLNPKYTANGLEGETALYLRIDYNPTWNKISHIEVTVPYGFVRLTFESADTPALRKRVCSDLQHQCPSDVWAAQGLQGTAECEAGLAALPVFNGQNEEESVNFTFDGNSKACRYLHAAMAAFNSKHCYHTSLVPLADPQGKIKCQTSSGLVADYSEGESAAWAQWLKEQGLEAGYKLDPYAGLTSAERAGIVVGGVLGTTLLCAATAFATCIHKGGDGGPGGSDDGGAREARSTEPAHTDPVASAGHDVPKISSQMRSPRSSGYKDHTVARMNDVGILLAICAVWGCVIVELVVRYGIDPSHEQDKGTVSDMRSLLFKQEDAIDQWDVTGTFPMNDMGTRAFLQYEALLFCICIVVTGLGTELVIGWYMCHEYDGEEETAAHFWKVAQFFFPFNAVIAVSAASHQNIMGIPFLVLGLWKFGFPETIGNMSCAVILFRGEQQNCSSRLRCLQHSLEALGTLTHHSCATLVITVLIVGLTPITQAIGEPISFLIIQHLVVLLKYRSWAIYVAVELAVEGMFEWSVLSNFEHYYQPHGQPAWPFQNVDPLIRRAAAGMLLAHWVYLASGAAGIAADAAGGGAGGGEAGVAADAEAGSGEPDYMYVSSRAVTFRKMQHISFTSRAGTRRSLAARGASMPMRSCLHIPGRRQVSEGGFQTINTESSGAIGGVASPISMFNMHTDTKSLYVPTPAREEQRRFPQAHGAKPPGRVTDVETSGDMQLTKRDVPIAVSFIVPDDIGRERTQAQGGSAFTGDAGAAPPAPSPRAPA